MVLFTSDNILVSQSAMDKIEKMTEAKNNLFGGTAYQPQGETYVSTIKSHT